MNEEHSFWENRWRIGWTPFHREDVNPRLLDFRDRFLDRPHLRILVPLCGKTVDIPWLASQGHEVVGVELAEVAVRDLVAREAETSGEFEESEEGPFRVFRSGNITLLHGDMLDAAPQVLGVFDRIFDRAALVALSPATRPAYAARLIAFLGPQGRILLDTVFHDDEKVAGPPFSVPRSEIEELFGDSLEIEVLGADPDAPIPEHLRERGLTRLQRLDLLLSRREATLPRP